LVKNPEEKRLIPFVSSISMAGFCGNGDKLWGPVKAGEFHHYHLSDYQNVKKNPAPL
jgi:hypothetical protein